jgi:hypothetical protein
LQRAEEQGNARRRCKLPRSDLFAMCVWHLYTIGQRVLKDNAGVGPLLLGFTVHQVSVLKSVPDIHRLDKIDTKNHFFTDDRKTHLKSSRLHILFCRYRICYMDGSRACMPCSSDQRKKERKKSFKINNLAQWYTWLSAQPLATQLPPSITPWGRSPPP